MAERKRIVRSNPYKKTVVLKVEREADFLWGKARGQVAGFSDFIRERGVVTLAVGIIIGTTVTAVARSLIDDIIDPLIGVVVGARRLDQTVWSFGDTQIRIGAFASALLDFFLIALFIYVLYRLLKLEKLAEKKENNKKKK